jgi:hypothetical protein
MFRVAVWLYGCGVVHALALAGAPFTTYCGGFIVRARPAEHLQSESWAVERADGSDQMVGTVAFKLDGAVARIDTFDIELGSVEETATITFDLEKDSVEVLDEEEGLSCFLLLLLDARLRKMGASVFEPEEVASMVEVAAKSWGCPHGKGLVCCDTDGRPLLTLPQRVINEQQLLFLLESEGGETVVARGGS